MPEPVSLVVRIDALGVHELGLYRADEALERLAGWLPRGEEAEAKDGAGADALLAGAERSALVTVTRYTTQGSAEVAGESSDLVLARYGGRLHSYARESGDGNGLVPRRLDGGVRATVASMLRD